MELLIGLGRGLVASTNTVSILGSIVVELAPCQHSGEMDTAQHDEL